MAHGLENLFIVGSYVFASASYANPIFTTVQLPVRLVERLSKKIYSQIYRRYSYNLK